MRTLRFFCVLALLVGAHVKAQTDEDFAAFKMKADVWRSLTNKPPLPEDTRKWRVLAENAYKEKRFEDTAKYYGEGLKVGPLWPEAQFNVAMIDSELGRYGDAAYHMRCYIELVPSAKDVEAAKDHVIIWQEKAKTPRQGAEYIVQEGDTLPSIAEKAYGSRSMRLLVAMLHANPPLRKELRWNLNKNHLNKTLTSGERILIPTAPDDSTRGRPFGGI